MSTKGIEWVTLRRFDDQIAAEMTLNFLRDHDVTVTVLGNSVSTTMLNRFNTILDIRLAVPREELEMAQEALRGLEPDGELAEQPFRGPTHRMKRDEEDGNAEDSVDGQAPRRRYRRAAILLAVLLPFGSGHFYARHNVAGGVFAAGIVGSTLLAMRAETDDPELFILFATLFVFADAIAAIFAVKRYNEGRVPEASAQFGGALLTLCATAFAGVLLRRLS
ncbi:MAG TPA: hypothetical protein VNO21_25365 [Polyangiaceae bacterium]|nr:hypothetical protein [Polyangiaceae bacterium]